jgi:hypothetical protein
MQAQPKLRAFIDMALALLERRAELVATSS